MINLITFSNGANLYRDIVRVVKHFIRKNIRRFKSLIIRTKESYLGFRERRVNFQVSSILNLKGMKTIECQIDENESSMVSNMLSINARNIQQQANTVQKLVQTSIRDFQYLTRLNSFNGNGNDGFADFSTSLSCKELVKLNDTPMTNNNGFVQELEELKILSATPKSKLLLLLSKLRTSFKTNLLMMTSKLYRIVNNTKFQHFIRICIILNSLR